MSQTTSIFIARILVFNDQIGGQEDIFSPRGGGGGAVKPRGRVCASHPTAPGLTLRAPKIFIIDVAEIYQHRWIEGSGQRLD